MHKHAVGNTQETNAPDEEDTLKMLYCTGSHRLLNGVGQFGTVTVDALK